MSIIERKKRHQQQVRAYILQKALEIAVADGWSSVSIRKIAEKIEYSSSVIYEYFENKESILKALREEGLSKLLGSLEGALFNVENPSQQLVYVTLAYWEFAYEQTIVYQLMFNLEGVYCSSGENMIVGNKIHGLVSAIIEDIYGATTLDLDTVDMLFENWWCLVHGFISLSMTHRLPDCKIRAKNSLLQALSLFIHGVRHIDRSVLGRYKVT